jgi:hypothetical protein
VQLSGCWGSLVYRALSVVLRVDVAPRNSSALSTAELRVKGNQPFALVARAMLQSE